MKKINLWLAAAIIITIIFGTIYAVSQQSQRMAANSPQIQLAEDTARFIDQGNWPSSLTTNSVDMNNSLAPFVIVYDSSGKVVQGNGYLNGKVPTVPFGVLKSAQGQAYHAVTWQPQPDVRIAAISVAAKNYYVLSGRSLREVERNEGWTFNIALVGGALSIATLAAVYISQDKKK